MRNTYTCCRFEFTGNSKMPMTNRFSRRSLHGIPTANRNSRYSQPKTSCAKRKAEHYSSTTVQSGVLLVSSAWMGKWLNRTYP